MYRKIILSSAVLTITVGWVFLLQALNKGPRSETWEYARYRETWFETQTGFVLESPDRELRGRDEIAEGLKIDPELSLYQVLGALGKEGWELKGLDSRTYSATYLFARRR